MNNDFFYFYETTSPDPSDIKDFGYEKKSEGSTWWLEFPGKLHFFNKMNRNVRQYLSDNVVERVFSDKNKDLMAHNKWYGEMGHPFAMFEGQKLTPKRIRTVLPANRAIKIQNPKSDGNVLTADIQTYSGNDVGRGFANAIIQGEIPSFSCRSTGEMKIVHGKPTVMINDLICYDVVDYSGFVGADMEGKAKLKTEFVESAENKVLVPDAIPFSELMDDIANENENIQAYMEEMNVQMKAVSDDGKHAILTNDDLYIYANMREKSVNRALNFYRDLGV